MGIWSSNKSSTTVNNTPTDEQIEMQNEKELLTALMNAGKIDTFDITDDTLRANKLSALQDLEANLANPFPDFLDETGKLLIDDVLSATEGVEDWNTRYANAKAKVAGLNNTADKGAEEIASLYDEDGVEKVFDEQNLKLREINEGIKALNVQEAGLAKETQQGVLDAGESYAESLAKTGEDTEGLLRDKENVLLQEASNIGDIMRRNAMVERRASEDAANQALKGLRSLSIGQGTGSNMRSAQMQNRAQQAQAMAQPMGQADLFQTASEADARAGTIEEIIRAREGRDLADVSSKEALLNNELRRLGYGDAEIMAAKTNLGLDMAAEEDDRALYNNLLNLRLGNLGLTASQAELFKYLASADDAIAFAETDELARRSEPYTARGTAPSPSTAYYSQPYSPAPQSKSFLDKVAGWGRVYNKFGEYANS